MSGFEWVLTITSVALMVSSLSMRVTEDRAMAVVKAHRSRRQFRSVSRH